VKKILAVASKGSLWRKSLFAISGFIARVPVIFHLHGVGLEKLYSSLPDFMQGYR